jgi:drug/metabolite transporter (DMT)-like permease
MVPGGMLSLPPFDRSAEGWRREVEQALQGRKATLAGGVALIVASACGFGAMAIFGRMAFDSGADLSGILAVRFTVAALLLALLAGLRGTVFPAGRQRWIALAMGGIGYVGQSACYFAALQFASAGLVALLLYLYPTLVGLLAAVFLGEKLTRFRVAMLALGFAGLALTVGAGGGQVSGIALGVVAAAIYAVYIVVGGRWLGGADPLAVSTLVCAAAAAVFLAWSGVHGARLPGDATGWLALGGIALFSTVIAILTFFAGLARLGARRAAVLSTLEPVVTILLAAIFLGETVGAWQMAGGAMILAAAILTATHSRG